MKLPYELSFLSSFFDDPVISYRSAEWLLSDFEATKWKYSFGYASPKTIDWNVMLEDGTSLTLPKHRNLLNGFKYFLTSSTRPHYGSGAEANAIQSQYIYFSRTLLIVDYLLLHAADFQLATYGLPGLSSNDLKHILSTVSSNNDSSESVYEWTKVMTNYCMELLGKTDPDAIDKTLEKTPTMTIVTPEQQDGNRMGLAASLIPRVRAALHLNGFYISYRGKGYTPNSVKLSNVLYRNTIKGRTDTKSVIDVLRYESKRIDFVREFPGAPVTSSEKNKISPNIFNIYRNALYNLGTLHELNIPAPTISDLMQILEVQIQQSAPGRFRTLPSSVVFDAFKHAVEFHLQHGQKLINGFCRLAIYCKSRNIKLSNLSDAEVISKGGKEIQKLGITQLGLSCRSAGVAPYGSPIKGEKNDYFNKLRSNSPLLELLGVYIGGVQLVVGALMARRGGELKDLLATTCLDITAKWLIFQNRKSTRQVFGLRTIEARPIEPIAVSMIQNLIRMQKILKRVGYIDEMTYLFATPATNGEAGLSQPQSYVFNRNLDTFCDYFEVKLNAKGERYYIRQHQLRRFFAMLFFHSNSFGGLETLQWMLGHTDMSHVYRYITESMEGTVLTGAKAQYLAEQLHRGGIQIHEDLLTLLKNRYGTEDFALVDTDELEDVIADLMTSGDVEIEPEFFEDGKGQHMRVIIKVKGVAL
ncbi:integrase [Pseudomonas sp. A-B-26]|uniref:integrase n=1 Tax=Pseudomonas sp. A-B-26 TaxID=2832406 RepID=UPI001CBC6C6C|nr:integrase [Pseudomonas sp. A-B-26]